MRTRLSRSIAGTVVLALTLSMVSSALAAKPSHETSSSGSFELAAGLACEGFGIQGSAQTANMTTFFDRDGNPVRILFTHASPFTVTNADTGKSITIPHGAAFHFTPHPDGSQTLVATGFTLEIQFPTDVPAGPSMTLYSGRVVIEISASGTSTVVSTKGKAVDLCAELAA